MKYLDNYYCPIKIRFKPALTATELIPVSHSFKQYETLKFRKIDFAETCYWGYLAPDFEFTYL